MREGGGHCRSSFCFFGAEYLSIHQLRKKNKKATARRPTRLSRQDETKGHAQI